MGDDVGHMFGELERFRADIALCPGRDALRDIMPAGGARNAVDAALWELESQRTATPVWVLAGLAPPRPLVTCFTLSADAPARMIEQLRSYSGARALKLKLDGDLDADAERIRLVRAERPDVWLMVDANQGYRPDALDSLIPILVDAEVALLEQPIARGREAELDGFRCPIPIAADESLLSLADLETLVGRFQVANIKLDKCGGLTEALLMETEARRLGLQVMVGNMAGSSLAAAPAFLLGQKCDFVDLDGPTFIAEDVHPAVAYTDGQIDCPRSLWGWSG
jgi:L-alanine-DL-glutamate epimerase-like enolase superfamily enzyme